jgi:hypothetical protein
MIPLLTMKISREWSRLRALDFTDRIYFDDERLILTKFNQVKPMILRSVDDHSPQAVRSWIGDLALSYGRRDDIKNRNIWLDLHECFDYLQECNLLPIQNEQLK